MDSLWLLTVAAALGMAVGWLLGRAAGAAGLARAQAERDLMAQRLAGVEDAAGDDRQTAAELAPLRHTLARMEATVRDLERDRALQFGEVGARLVDVAGQAEALRAQTATLTGALNASAVRGTWGEVQLRRILEHAGMLARCDYDEQVGAVSSHEARVRPDVVVRLPGDKVVVIDAKAPMGAFLQAQRDGIPESERAAHLVQHAAALRAHVEALAGKAYWSAFATTPELVICFVPSDAVLAAALRAAPELYDQAQSHKVVLASPAVLLTVLRALALAWQQDALTRNATELLRLGADLHERLGTLGRHAATMGAALRRSVESYNAMVGTLESRVMVTSRQLRDLDLAASDHEVLRPVEATPRPLTAPELIDAELAGR